MQKLFYFIRFLTISLRERHEVVKRAVTQGSRAEPFVCAGLALKPVPAPKGYLDKLRPLRIASL